MGCYYFNRAWLEFRGRSLEQEFGNGWAQGVHPEDLERCVHHYVSCFERRMAFAMSYRLQDAAGNYQWILDRGAPHFLRDGSFLGFFGGCAEIESTTAIVRNAQLGCSLKSMREFARRVATEGVVALRSLKSTTEVPLQRFARDVQHEHEDRKLELEYAASKLEQLAVDMDGYRKISHGECIP